MHDSILITFDALLHAAHTLFCDHLKSEPPLLGEHADLFVHGMRSIGKHGAQRFVHFENG